MLLYYCFKYAMDGCNVDTILYGRNYINFVTRASAKIEIYPNCHVMYDLPREILWELLRDSPCEHVQPLGSNVFSGPGRHKDNHREPCFQNNCTSVLVVVGC